MYWRSDEWIMTSFSFLHVNLQATMSRRGKWAKISIRISVEKVRKGGSIWGRQSRVDRFSRPFYQLSSQERIVTNTAFIYLRRSFPQRLLFLS